MVLVINTEKILPETAPVRLAGAQLEEPDYRKLIEAYSTKGRKSSADAKVMFQIKSYGYRCGIYSNRDIEESCCYGVDFMWLLGNERYIGGIMKIQQLEHYVLLAEVLNYMKAAEQLFITQSTLSYSIIMKRKIYLSWVKDKTLLSVSKYFKSFVENEYSVLKNRRYPD